MLTLNIPRESWKPTGPDDDKTARLLAQIEINGLSMHLEAIAVIDRPIDDVLDGDWWEPTGPSDLAEEQVASNNLFEGDVACLQTMHDTAFKTIVIDERDYILVATPHGL